MMSISEVRKMTKQALKGNWGLAIGGMALAYVILGAVSMINFIPVLGTIAYYIFAGPFMIGAMWFFLAISRQEKPDIGYLFSGFKTFGRNLLAAVLVFIFTFLWSLLFLIPGIIKSFSYSQTFMILRDDPNISPLDAITESRHRMNGHKGRLFGLILSYAWVFFIPVIVMMVLGIVAMASTAMFDYSTSSYSYEYYSSMPDMSPVFAMIFVLGYFLMAAVLFGLAIWIYPQILVAMAVFYDDLYASTGTFNEAPATDDLEPTPYTPDEGPSYTIPPVEPTPPEEPEAPQFENKTWGSESMVEPEKETPTPEQPTENSDTISEAVRPSQPEESTDQQNNDEQK
ncbi:hypothetical protein PWEIH_02874 [Listeria weihenstephanensis FSL R9-0317]|uniref:DUF975 family protein n=1 Tax=Listeria weihenstephanensis TaxID=1006155 RepID=A0A1S7FSC5_9LIST|nr:DUF975 family protein [Listeria weihenstephanensis]AQY50324.1 hypothetical protein UE46_04300 [Listeria weihenstephanensis]EUJ40953.1 hypothetical protein PWEIH_02874 [Listeria weihenstephanensis FSL R9-0317]